MWNFRTQVYELLRRSERFFKTDMVYLTKGGFWLSLGQGFAIVAGFLTSLAFANFIPKESFGTYKFILSITGIISIFSLTGIATAVTQAAARGIGGSLKQGFRINLKWSIGVFVSGMALSLYYYLNDNILLSISLLLAGILSPIISSANLYGAYLTGKKDFRRSSFYGIIRSIASAALIILALYLTKNVLVVVAVYFISAAIILFYLYRRTLKVYQFDNSAEDPTLVSYGGHLSAMDIIGSTAGYLDKILIFHYLGAAPLAIYAFAIAPVEQLQSGKKILSTLIISKVSTRPFKELQESGPRKALLLTLYALGIAGVWMAAAPYFYKFLFPQYLDSVFYSQIYALTLLAVSGTIFNDTLIAHKKKKELYVHRIVIPVSQIILFVVLLPKFGLLGLIITHVIMRSFSGLLSYYFVRFPFGRGSSS